MILMVDIHMHTTYSDGVFYSRHGRSNISKGYKFMVITDHSGLCVANGLQVERL